MSRETSRNGRVPERRWAILALLAALSVSTMVLPAAANASGPHAALGPRGEVALPPFGQGESLTFEVKYGFVSAGTAVMWIPELVYERGYLCYRIVSIAESNAFISVFFHVRDVAESLLDVRDLVSRRFEKHLREGDYRAHDLVIFDHDRHVAIYPEKGRVVPISLDTQDILSSLYYVRMMDLEVGRSVYIENHADKKNYPLEIRVLGKDRIEVPAGRFDCIVVEPIMRATGLFRHKGSLKVWLTDDALHLPVKMASKVIIGSVTAVLTDVTLAGEEEDVLR